MKNFIILILLSITMVGKSFSQGDLMIYPKRLVFQEVRQSKEITLINSGSDTAIYQLSFVNYRMLENGKFEKVKTPDESQLFAEDYLRIFPRRVTLGPQETQKVKVQVYRANQLESGEYRSHLYFRAIEKEKPLERKTSNEESTGISTKLEMVFGISIPVILEVGNPQVKIALINLKVNQDSSPKIDFMVLREGNKSSYGDFKVIHADISGKETEVGSVKGVAVYAPIPQRHFSLKLKDGVDYSSGKLKVVYHAQEGKKETFAETSLQL